MWRPLCLAFLVSATVFGHGQVMAMGLTSKSTLLGIPEVKTELKITPALDKKLQARRQELRSVPDKQGVNDMQHPFRTVDREMVKLLSARQRRRLHELFLQENGLLSLSEPEVADQLRLQKSTQRSAQEAIDHLMDQVMTHLADVPEGGQWDPVVIGQYKAQAHRQLASLLAPEAKRRWEKMKGKPFKFPASMRPASSAGFAFSSESRTSFLTWTST